MLAAVLLTACRLPFSADSAASVLPQGARPDGGQSDTPDQTGDWLSGLSAALTGPFTAGRIVRAEAVDHRSGLTFEYPVLGRIDPYGMETLGLISDGAGGSELSADTLIGRITVCELPAGADVPEDGVSLLRCLARHREAGQTDAGRSARTAGDSPV